MRGAALQQLRHAGGMGWRGAASAAAAEPAPAAAAAAGARPGVAAAAAAGPALPVLEREFSVYRWDTGRFHTYTLDLNSCGPTVVDALLKIRAEQDPHLSVGVGCRRGRCGACACTIDGQNRMACQTRVPRVAGEVMTVKSITAPLEPAAADPS